MNTFLARKIKVPLPVAVLAVIVIVVLAGLLLSSMGGLAGLQGSAGGGMLWGVTVQEWDVVYRELGDSAMWTCADPEDSAYEAWTLFSTYEGTFSACMAYVNQVK